MTLQDVDAVHRLDVQSFSLPWPQNAFRHEVSENANARCWVAEKLENGASQIAGMIVAWLILDDGHIATLAGDSALRRRGIAACLLAHCLEEVKKEGAQYALLEVRCNNLAAQALYFKFGFTVDGRRKRYYVDTGEDAILMSLHNLQNRNFPTR